MEQSMPSNARGKRRRRKTATNNGGRHQAVPGQIDARRRPEAAIENSGRRAEAATNNGRRQAEAAHPHKGARRPGADINSRRRLVAIVDGVDQLVGWRVGKLNRWRCRTMSTSWPSCFTSSKDCWSASVDSRPTS
ncbi:unnamed protein product [Callosobruchus maculatus]|uniref:Uncharacterized protein n=1 Tax=Callosobruchus maculatus TaxID=64391 RepID=A0A653C4Q2_CALMS|nr:unnamed protein product [Callosobruchus maculatus]